MLKTTKPPNKPAPSRNNGCRLASSRNNDSRSASSRNNGSKPASEKNNSNGEIDGFGIGGSGGKSL